MTETDATPPATSTQIGKAKLDNRPIYLNKHYDLLYWWVVWLYAAIAWAITAAAGKSIVVSDKSVKFYEEPLLGIGFVAVLLFVAIFTTVRARGAMSAILVFGLIFLGVAFHYVIGWEWAMAKFPELRVHMNQAFYAVVFCVLFPVWLLTTFIFNRFHYYTFNTGRQVGDIHVLGGGSKTFAAHSVSIVKLPDDIFVHRVLGLWWLGLGTGDVILTYSEPGGTAHREVIENIWRVDRKIRQINNRIQ